MADPRKLPLAAAVEVGRLVITIGVDTLDAMRERMGIDDPRISTADIADFLVDPLEYGDASPFEIALRQAFVSAKDYDDEREATTEPSTEFFR